MGDAGGGEADKGQAGLAISVVREPDQTVLAVAGELDLATAARLADTVDAELRGSPGRIVVDLAEVTFCDSLGLGTLIVLSRTAQNQNTFLQLRNLRPFFRKMLDITGVGPGLNISPE
jgi:anti-sigma B factor antagonist